MRHLTLLFALAACASPGIPPGAPPDSTAPRVLKVTPDSGTLSARAGGVQFLFSEVVSERPQGASDLAGLFLISPYDGEPRVSWRRTRIEVSPRKGLRPNTTYVVRLLPGLADLRGNDDSVGRTIIFSTGPSIAAGVMHGIVFDWAGQRPSPRAFVTATSFPDSSARYVAVTDSVGNFTIQAIPPGRYILRAFIDENRNRLIDLREPFDSATVTLSDSIRREMLAIVRDTLGPGIATITRADSVTLRVTFDRGVDSTQRLTVADFTLKAQDSSVVVIDTVIMGRAFERQREDSIRRQAIQDSVRRSAQQDSIRRIDSSRAAAAGRPLGRRPGAPPGVRAVRPASDTTRRELAKPSVPSPETDVILRLDQPIRAGAAFRLKATNIRSFLGYRRTSERQFQTPRAPPRDSTTPPPTRRDTVDRR
ncbi:MAG: Ig-like domain-containing protein [Gemmatimonadaceae bacterium]